MTLFVPLKAIFRIVYSESMSGTCTYMHQTSQVLRFLRCVLPGSSHWRMNLIKNFRRQVVTIDTSFNAIHAHRSANGRMSLPDNDNDLTRAKLST